jgi:hypothetical protein
MNISSDPHQQLQAKPVEEAAVSFCPWDSSHSVFIKADDVVDFGRGQTVCMDTIIYGYDLVFERLELWRLMAAVPRKRSRVRSPISSSRSLG